MPKGVPDAGFRKTKRFKTKSLEELEQEIASKAPGFAEELEKYIKPFQCPHCGGEIQVIDKEVAMYMLDRALGKPRQKLEVDVLPSLTADKIDMIIENHRDGFIAMAGERYLPEIVARNQIAIRALLTQGEAIEGEYKELTEGVTDV